MLNSNHPDDERLSALASHDPEADADDTLTSHITSCTRCADLVDELGALRASLAELPDLAPSRPLQLLPPIDEPVPATVDRVGGWVRRLFAPALTAGAALAMVGLVGTASPALQEAGTSLEADQQIQAEPGAGEGDDAGGETAPAQVLGATDTPNAAEEGAVSGYEAEDEARSATDALTDAPADDFAAHDLPAERSPWPMVLFSGVALMVGAALVRWILVPRAG